MFGCFGQQNAELLKFPQIEPIKVGASLLLVSLMLMTWFLCVLDIMKSKSNPDFTKKEKSTTSRQLRTVRSKVSAVLVDNINCVNFSVFTVNIVPPHCVEI